MVKMKTFLNIFFFIPNLYLTTYLGTEIKRVTINQLTMLMYIVPTLFNIYNLTINNLKIF